MKLSTPERYEKKAVNSSFAIFDPINTYKYERKEKINKEIV